MKTKHFFRLMAAFLLAAVLPISFASCGDDDDDVDNGNGGGSIVPGGTVVVNIRNANNGDYYDSGSYVYLEGIYTQDGYEGQDQLRIDESDNLYLSRGKIVCVGKVSGLGAIKTIPQSGWSDKAVVMPGYGYIVKGPETTIYGKDCTPHYARIYVVDYMTNTSGGVIGATIQYQCPWGG